MPEWLRTIAEWNPISAVVEACRQLFGNGSFVVSDAWPMQHPVAASLIWFGIITGIFAPLAINKYKRTTAK
jgi:ABC-2 type transport system permease protein